MNPSRLLRFLHTSLLLPLCAGLPISTARAQPSPQQPTQSPPARPTASPQTHPAASQAAQPGETQSTTPDAPQSPPPAGKVLFSRGTDAAPDSQPAAPQPAGTESTPPQFAPPTPAASEIGPGDADPLHVTEAERTALTFTAYDLDLHLTPASASVAVRAGLTVRNDSAAPLTRLVLQLSSSLRWDAISIRTSAAAAPASTAFVARLVETDADHTGAMSEAVITLIQPLAPGASLSLIALYSGAIPFSAERLTRIGVPPVQATAQDWDAIVPSDPDHESGGTALRGFGNVLWYPVSAPPVFLGDGAKLFDLVGRAKLRESAATIRLRLAIEYAGEPPDAAYLCGRREQLIALSDNPSLPVAESRGIATATFAPQPLGFRTPSLFVTAAAASLTGTPANPGLIAALTSRDAALPAYSAAAAEVEPLLTDWLGAQPQRPLTLLDHPGDPFEDDALLVTPMRVPPDPATLAPTLVHSLTHAWIRSTHPWIDEGLPEFMALLWTEHTAGRAAALAQLQDSARSLAIAEPDPGTSNSGAAAASVSPAGASLADASGDVFYRTKAAAVWWMLRGIVGDDPLQQALQDYRRLCAKDSRLDRDPAAFEHALEAVSHKDLSWFFRDWVYQDRGLPDLRIANLTPSRLESHAGVSDGWLVAVEVRNDGYPAAEVPVTVRSANSSQTERLRIPGRSSASTRIIFAGTPQQVQVNDGSVPETETSIHTRELVLPAK